MRRFKGTVIPEHKLIPENRNHFQVFLSISYQMGKRKYLSDFLIEKKRNFCIPRYVSFTFSTIRRSFGSYCRPVKMFYICLLREALFGIPSNSYQLTMNMDKFFGFTNFHNEKCVYRIRFLLHILCVFSGPNVMPCTHPSVRL